MGSTLIQVADAVAGSLQGAILSQPFSVARKYVPKVDLSALEELHVTVAPKSLQITKATRDTDYFDCTVDIGIQRRVNPESNEAIDVLSDLVQEIIEHLRSRPLPDYPDAMLTVTLNDPAFSLEHLDELRTFTSVVSLTYRVRR